MCIDKSNDITAEQMGNLIRILRDREVSGEEFRDKLLSCPDMLIKWMRRKRKEIEAEHFKLDVIYGNIEIVAHSAGVIINWEETPKHLTCNKQSHSSTVDATILSFPSLVTVQKAIVALRRRDYRQANAWELLAFARQYPGRNFYHILARAVRRRIANGVCYPCIEEEGQHHYLMLALDYSIVPVSRILGVRGGEMVP